MTQREAPKTRRRRQADAAVENLENAVKHLAQASTNFAKSSNPNRKNLAYQSGNLAIATEYLRGNAIKNHNLPEE